jgi:hypothetical protein
MKSKLVLICLLLVGFYSQAQQARFTYQYHNEVAKGGQFSFFCLDTNLVFEAPASAGYLEANNNPYMQATVKSGPIPSGTWEIYKVKNETKSILRLRPTDDVAITYRDGFLIHGKGDKKSAEESSTGCIILEPKYRAKLVTALKKYGKIQLIVTATTTGDKVD